MKGEALIRRLTRLIPEPPPKEIVVTWFNERFTIRNHQATDSAILDDQKPPPPPCTGIDAQ